MKLHTRRADWAANAIATKSDSARKVALSVGNETEVAKLKATAGSFTADASKEIGVFFILG